jgi:hypothetical protein
MMEIGPLEYVVIGLKDDGFRNIILPELNMIQQSDLEEDLAVALG